MTLFWEPDEGAQPGRDGAGVGPWERFGREEVIFIDAKGGMSVSTARCLRVSQEDLAEVERYWHLFLERLDKTDASLQVLENPYTGNDWRVDGPMLGLSFGSAPEKNVQLLWDGHPGLSKELDTAVIATLELACSNSRLAKKHLLEGLPRQVAVRLECSAT